VVHRVSFVSIFVEWNNHSLHPIIRNSFIFPCDTAQHPDRFANLLSSCLEDFADHAILAWRFVILELVDRFTHFFICNFVIQFHSRSLFISHSLLFSCVFVIMLIFFLFLFHLTLFHLTLFHLTLSLHLSHFRFYSKREC